MSTVYETALRQYLEDHHEDSPVEMLDNMDPGEYAIQVRRRYDAMILEDC